MQKIVKARFLCTERKFKTMSQHLLDIENLTVAVEDKEILHGVNLQVNEGETHVLMGPNGAGKSTLGYALMGNPQYKVTGGSILFHGKEQQGLSAVPVLPKSPGGARPVAEKLCAQHPGAAHRQAGKAVCL